MHLLLLFILLLFSTSQTIAQSRGNNAITEALSATQHAIDRGEFKTALLYLKNAAQQYPNNSKIKIALADLYIKTGYGKEAEIELDKAGYLGIKKKDTELLKIKAQLIQGKFADVTSQINKVLSLNSKDIGRIRALQGVAFLNQGKMNKARQYFIRAAKLAPDALETRIALARLEILDNKAEQARYQIISLYSDHPYNANVLLMMGNLYRKEKQYIQAETLFNKVISIQPGNTAARIGLAITYISSDQLQKARSIIAKILVIDAENEAANHLLAILFFTTKEYRKALYPIGLIEKNNPDHKGLLLVSGSVYYELGKLNYAEKKFKKFLLYDPGNLSAKKLLAKVYLKKQQAEKVIPLLIPYKESKDTATLALLNRAYKAIGDEQKAVEFYNKIVKINAQDPQTLKYTGFDNSLADNPQKINLQDEQFKEFNSTGLSLIFQLLKNNHINSALKLIKHYQTKEPGNSVLYTLLGQAYWQEGNLDNAQINFKKALKLDPKQLEPRFNLARIALEQNDIKKSELEYLGVLGVNPYNETAMIKLAQLSYAKKNTDAMLNWLNKARENNKMSIQSRLILHNYYSLNKDLDNALIISNELYKIQADNLNILKLHADNLLKAKEFDSAIKIYKEMIALQPDSATAYYLLASVQYLTNDISNARINFSKVVSLEPDNIIARNALIRINLNSKSNNLSQSLFQAGELIAINPNIALSHETLADVYLLKNKPEKAIKSYKTALSLQNNNPVIANKIARTYTRSGNTKAAAEILEQWLKKYPGNIKIRLSLALLYQKEQKLEQAAKHYEAIIGLFPEHLSAVNNLALIYNQLDDPKALEYAEIAFSLAPSNTAVLDTLVQVLVKSKNHSRILSLLEKAIKANPSYAIFRYYYALSLVEKKKNKEAIKQLNMVIHANINSKIKKQAKKLLQKIQP